MINETLFFPLFFTRFSQRILMKFHDCCVELSLCYDIDNALDPRSFSSSSSSSGVFSLLYVLLLATKGYMRSLNELFMWRLVYISFCFLSHHLFFHIFILFSFFSCLHLIIYRRVYIVVLSRNHKKYIAAVRFGVYMSPADT